MQVIKLNVRESGLDIPTVFNISRISDIREILSGLRVAFIYKSMPKRVQYICTNNLEDIPEEPCYVPGARTTLPCIIGGAPKDVQLQVDDILLIRASATAPAESFLISVGKRGGVVSHTIPMDIDDIVTQINSIQCGSGGGSGTQSILIEGRTLLVGDNIVNHPAVSGRVAAVSISIDGEWQSWPFNYTGVSDELTQVNLPSSDEITVDIYLIF
jgi:hypothetical protein